MNGTTRGTVYHCPVCGSEITVIAGRVGAFAPVCCNRPMIMVVGRNVFYICPVCGTEVLCVKRGKGRLIPVCCNKEMTLAA